MSDDATDTPAEAADEATDEATAEAVDEAVAEDAPEPSEAKKKADAVIAERQAKAPQVTRRTVTSRRVTPKGGAAAPSSSRSKGKGDEPPAAESKARDAKKTEAIRHRTPTPAASPVYAKGPSPWWVPTIMWVLLVVGALVIMSNYMGVFGDASNVRLVIGLGLILGGIIAATQYR